MSDFSRLYGARLHQTQRTGPVPGTLPAMTEVDELMNKTRHTLDALGRMRAVLAEQQAVFYQQAQEQQRYRAESDAKRNDSVHQSEDAKAGGFAGGDAKKRRGVCTMSSSLFSPRTNNVNSERRHLEDVTAVTAPKHPNGVGDRTAPAPFVMRVAYVSFICFNMQLTEH